METVRALLRYARSPIDFVVAARDMPSRRAIFDELAAESGRGTASEVRLISPESLASGLSAGSYRVIHDLVAYRPGVGSYLRDRFARNPIACTTIHYGLSSPSAWLRDFFPASLPGGRAYDATFYSSSAAADFLRRFHASLAGGMNGTLGDAAGYRGRYVHIPLGVDAHRFRPRDQAEVRDALGLPRDALILYWTGRLSPRTKADLAPLIKMTAEIRRSQPDLDVFLLIVGSGEESYIRHLRSLIRRFGLTYAAEIRTGIPAFAVPLLYSAADIFVGLSDVLGESFGLTVVEAMASGLPVVAADWAGYRDTVTHGETGFKIPTIWARCDTALSETSLFFNESDLHFQEAQSVAVEWDSFSQNLQDLLRDARLRQEMGKKGRERAVELYGWESVVRQYEEVWDELSAEARSSAQTPPGVFPLVRPSEIFRAHPTEFISMETLVRLSQLGADCLRGKMQLSPDAEMASHLDPLLLEKLQRSAGKRAAFRPAPVGKVLDGVVGSDTNDRAEALRHLMWLLKYDLLEVASA
jgi:glycosyltransferase involved in cell wall biosynthesis